MNKIPTAEEYFDGSNLGLTDNTEYQYCKDTVIKAAIKFTQLHREAILEAAADRAVARENPSDYGTGEIWVDEESILNAYPKSLIK